MLCWKWGPRHSGPPSAVSVPATSSTARAHPDSSARRLPGGPGVRDLCGQSPVQPEGGPSIRKGGRRRPQRPGGLHGRGRLDRRSHPGSGSSSGHRALPFREGSGDPRGSGSPQIVSHSLGFSWEPASVEPAGRPCCGMALGRRGRRAPPPALVFRPIRLSLSDGFAVIGSQ